MAKVKRWSVVLVLALCFVLSSCTAVRNAVKDYRLANTDPVLVAEVQKSSADVSAITRAVACAIPGAASYADLIGQVASMIVAFAVGHNAGKKKREGVG